MKTYCSFAELPVMARFRTMPGGCLIWIKTSDVDMMLDVNSHVNSVALRAGWEKVYHAESVHMPVEPLNLAYATRG